VLPFLAGGDLFSRCKYAGENGLPMDEARRYFKQIATGLLYMKRTCSLAHHDVSLENICLDQQKEGGFVAKLIDLGMSIRMPRDRCCSSSNDDDEEEDEVGNGKKTSSPLYLFPQACHGKPSYLSPDVVYEQPHDPYAADVWSLGICLYIMLTGR